MYCVKISPKTVKRVFFLYIDELFINNHFGKSTSVMHLPSNPKAPSSNVAAGGFFWGHFSISFFLVKQCLGMTLMQPKDDKMSKFLKNVGH